jgi:hypothetical protein
VPIEIFNPAVAAATVVVSGPVICDAVIAMEPIVNLDENVGKAVGRRRPADAFATAMKLQKTVNELQSHLTGICPKGVFRFKTHKEADEWLLKWMSRRRPRTS